MSSSPVEGKGDDEPPETCRAAELTRKTPRAPNTHTHTHTLSLSLSLSLCRRFLANRLRSCCAACCGARAWSVLVLALRFSLLLLLVAALLRLFTAVLFLSVVRRSWHEISGNVCTCEGVLAGKVDCRLACLLLQSDEFHELARINVTWGERPVRGSGTRCLPNGRRGEARARP